LFNPAIGVDWGAKYLASLLAWAKGDYARRSPHTTAAASGNEQGAVQKSGVRRQRARDERDTADDVTT
jgi:hypothetical protein